MITRLKLKNWKSFDEAELFVDQLTVVIGTNAAGKSNALDALEFLNRTVQGWPLTSCLAGDSGLAPVRGGVEWAVKNQSGSFTVGVLVRADETTEYEYNISAHVIDGRCEVTYEEIIRRKLRKFRGREEKITGEIHLFRTDQPGPNEPSLKARLYNKASGTVRQLSRASSALSQLLSQATRQEISEGIQVLVDALRGIFILDPIPSHMREYTPLSDQLEPDAGNIAGVIAALPSERQTNVERTITAYLSKLPERDIHRVYVEKVGRFRSDAMLYCEERWQIKGDSTLVDARGMSDGTLRFLAILTALLTRPEKTLLVIEEVDNGLHPSRSYLLLDMLSKIGNEREVDIIVTTHNPALLDTMGPSAIPFITAAHRDPETGASKLTLLENLDNLARVLGHGPLGTLSSKGIIERALRGDQLALDFSNA